MEGLQLPTRVFPCATPREVRSTLPEGSDVLAFQCRQVPHACSANVAVGGNGDNTTHNLPQPAAAGVLTAGVPVCGVFQGSPCEPSKGSLHYIEC